jgi:hypothetical protein
MRSAVGIFGAVSGVIVVALVGRYGFVTSDTALDGAIAAFFFGVIAVGGIGGPAVAVHLLKAGKGWGKTWGIIAGAIALVALLANLSNSLGAIAGRADKTLAERSKASEAKKDARAELARLAAERKALPTFVPATEDDVGAAREAVAAAARITKAECGDGTDAKQRGPRCRQREAEEGTKREALAGILERKGITDRAAQIDADAADERRKLETAPPVSSANPMAETLARIFHVQADDAATWQQVVTVVVVELLIAFSLVAWELLTPPRVTAIEGEIVRPRRSSPRRTRISAPAAILIEAKPAGDVAQFAVAHLRPAPEATLAIGDLYQPYREWCSGQGMSAVSAPKFDELFAALCDLSGFGRTQNYCGKALCIGLQLTA